MQRQRKRRHHHRSKNGCQTCRQRHVRCDESRPFCRNCLSTGGACGYSKPQSSDPSSTIQHVSPVLWCSCDRVRREPANLGSASSYSNQWKLAPSDCSTAIAPLSFATGEATGISESWGLCWSSQNSLASRSREIGDSGAFPPPERSSICSRCENPKPSVAAMQGRRLLNRVTTILGVGRSDPFQTLPVKLSHGSNMLLDHFQNYRVFVRFPIRRKPGGDMFKFAISDLAVLHACILLAATHWVFIGGSPEKVSSIFYHHKVEALSLLNARLEDPVTAVADGTAGSVAVLTVLECLTGSLEMAKLHMNGLAGIIKMRTDSQTPDANGTLMRIILMADILTSSASNSPRRFQENDAGAIVLSHQKAPRTMLQTLHIEDTQQRSEELNGLDNNHIIMFTNLSSISKISASTNSNFDAVIASTIHHMYSQITDTTRNNQSTEGCCAVTGYIYLQIFFGAPPTSDPFSGRAVNLLRDKLEKVVVSDSDSQCVYTVYPSTLLFWMLFVGGCATNAAEGGEGIWFRKHLAVGRRVLGLQSWEETRELLQRFAWVSRVEGEGNGWLLWQEVDEMFNQIFPIGIGP